MPPAEPELRGQRDNEPLLDLSLRQQDGGGEADLRAEQRAHRSRGGRSFVLGALLGIGIVALVVLAALLVRWLSEPVRPAVAAEAPPHASASPSSTPGETPDAAGPSPSAVAAGTSRSAAAEPTPAASTKPAPPPVPVAPPTTEPPSHGTRATAVPRSGGQQPIESVPDCAPYTHAPAEALRDFLKAQPDGACAAVARARLSGLEAAAEAEGRLPPVQTPVGRVQVEAKPWADISVDGREIGRSPLPELQLSPGPHEIRFSHPDYRPLVHKVDVGAGETLLLQVDWSEVGVPLDKETPSPR